MNEKIMRLAIEAGFLDGDLELFPETIERFAELVRRNERALAKAEQVITPISPDQYERFCGKCGACVGKPWVGLTDKEIKGILDCGRNGLVDIKKAEQILKDKNT
jgi:hypothetical protein